MTENWAAVAGAINDRLRVLPMTQTTLHKRAGVAKRTVYELRHTVVRNRSERTLAAVSVALGWHPNHLDTVLHGEQPPRTDDPVVVSDHDVPGLLHSLQHELRLINRRMDSTEDRIDIMTAQLNEIADEVRTLARRLAP